MVKKKATTLRRVHKNQKQTYFHKGGQNIIRQNIIVETIQSYLNNEIKNNETITSIGNNIYENETIEKYDSLNLTFEKQSYDDSLKSKIELLKSKKDNIIELYGKEYISYFLIPFLDLQSIYNEEEDYENIVDKIENKIKEKDFHIHLIESYLKLKEQFKIQINPLLLEFESIKENIENLFIVIQKDYENNKNRKKIETEAIQTKKQELINNPDTIIDNTKSDYIVWNKVNEPMTIFKRKEVEYCIPLQKNDSHFFNVKYIVSEIGGTPKKDTNDQYKFIVDLQFGWNQNIPEYVYPPSPSPSPSPSLSPSLSPSPSPSPSLSPSPSPSPSLEQQQQQQQDEEWKNDMITKGYTYYYMDYDGIPQPVIIIHQESPILHKDESETHYIGLLNQKDRVLAGFEYIEVDKDGSILRDKNSSILPFYPEIENYKKMNTTFTKTAPNGIDTISYVIQKTFTESVPNVYSINDAAIDTTLLNAIYSNLIDIFYINKYVELELQDYYPPFVLPSFIINLGDYIIFHNKSFKFPIFFNVSKTIEEKRVILYPQQTIIFVYSESPQEKELQYGFLLYNKNNITKTKTSKISLVNTTNNYVYIDNNKPLVDSEDLLIPVNVKDINSTTTTIVDPIHIENPQFSIQYIEPQTLFVCLTNIVNVFIFCDENGLPTINKDGYFETVPGQMYMINNQYCYNSNNTMNIVTIKNNYLGYLNIDTVYHIEDQFTTQYSASFNLKNIFTDKDGNPIISDIQTYVEVPNTITTTQLNINIAEHDLVKSVELNMIDKQQTINVYYCYGVIKIMNDNTLKLKDYFVDLSSNSIYTFPSQYTDLDQILQEIKNTKDIKLLESAENKYEEVKSSYDKIMKLKKR